MNTLRILKGKDITLSVDDTVLCFVTDFVAQESSDVYKIEEFLSDSEVDSINFKKSYVITITALTHLNQRVFDKENFTLRIDDGNTAYEYINCRLKDKKREILSSKPITDKYTIIASDMKVLEGLYE